MTDIIKLISSELGDSITSTGAEIRFCCPFCIKRGKNLDTKYHLYLNTSKRVFICHRCGTKGGVKKILNLLGITEEVNVRSWDQVIMSLTFISGKIYDTEQDPNIPLEYPVKTFKPQKGLFSYKYLIDRGITEEQIETYKFQTGTGKYRDRIFIPVFNENGDMIFWVARGFGDYWGPKYLNPQDRLRKYYLFNFNNIKDGSDIIITEGVFSAIAAGPKAVATFGKIVTKNQIDLLVSKNLDTYYVALDADATEEAAYLADQLSNRGKKVRIVNLPYGEDPDSISNFSSYLNKSVPWNFNTKIEFLLNQ